MKNILTLFAFLFCIMVSFAVKAQNIRITPQPMEIKEGSGVFPLKPSTRILVDAGNKEIHQIVKLIVQKINMAGGPLLSIGEYTPEMKIKNAIVLTLQGADQTLGKEGYTLDVTTKSIVLKAISSQGLYYGMLSFLQLLPPEVESQEPVKADYVVPVVSIRDMPRFPYRGLHLDVGRHMYPVSFIKKYIDLMSMYKMNTFHWHLTEDQGWRIQIRKYPRLTQVGSTRLATAKGKTSEFDGVPYGGFYSQDQIREIVAYAADKFVTIIPEIEMPGHSVAALTAYPHLSCTGGPFQVRQEWGVADDILCAGNDSAFIFVQDVLTEVMELFPSTYIHIGGDEAPKTRWEECPKCQKRMQDEGLKSEMELQSYFIKRVERFLSSKGRRLIGWDEILEGGLAPEATVMSWRGMQGGIDAAMQNHDVIMTPTDYCYLDYYQADPATEPLAIGGMLTLKTVYSFEPTPPVLTAEQAKHILGAQGNVWTEYIKTPEMVEYMTYPRAIALAEVNWSQKDARNWDDFVQRMENQYKRLSYLGVNYSKGSMQTDITTVRDSIQHRNLVLISSETKGYPIYYTIDGSEPNALSIPYSAPFELKSSSIVKAVMVKDGEVIGQSNERNITVNLASGKPVKILKPYSFKYPGTGDQAMTDGLTGTASLKTGWQGYEGTDMEIVVDLITPSDLHKISTTFIQSIGSWVIYPVEVEFLLSSDGVSFQSAGKIETAPNPQREKQRGNFQ
ncbi:MAG: family 20 glycosylhydrolase [Bacteroidales bacterium]|nr:family 20 glycosylhydrolase [Bacteroidales bacterium]